MNQEIYPVRDKYRIYQEITDNSSRTVQLLAPVVCKSTMLLYR